jgi:hypothetical protein
MSAKRQFTEIEDAVIRRYCAGKMTMYATKKRLGTGEVTIRTRAAELGLTAPPVNSDDGLTPPITTGDDPYLAALRKVHHGGPRSEQYPCSLTDSRPLNRRPAW